MNSLPKWFLLVALLGLGFSESLDLKIRKSAEVALGSEGEDESDNDSPQDEDECEDDDTDDGIHHGVGLSAVVDLGSKHGSHGSGPTGLLVKAKKSVLL